MQGEQVTSEVDKYYSSDNGYRFYDIINGGDYTGLGMYPDFKTEKREDGSEYPRGDKQTVAEATLRRDRFILQSI